MFGLMLKSTHEEKMRIALAVERQRQEIDREYYKRKIKAMQPDYEYGKKRRAQNQKATANRKAKSQAKKVAA
jgi:hypothetical protein